MSCILAAFVGLAPQGSGRGAENGNAGLEEWPRLKLAGAIVRERDAATSPGQVRAWLSRPSDIPVSVHYTLLPGTAQPGSDYLPDSGTLVFEPGIVETSLRVRILDDQIAEGNEAFGVHLDEPLNVRLAESEVEADVNVVIVDDEPVPAITVADVIVREREPGAATNVLNFHLVLSNPSEQDVQVAYATRSGTAEAGSDYLPQNGTSHFGPGQTEVSVEVPVLDDDLSEDDETLFLELREVRAATVKQAEARGTIIDEDGSPALRVGDARILEGGPGETNSLVFEILLRSPPKEPVTLRYKVVGGTADEGIDFVPTEGILTLISLGAGDIRHVVRVPILGDADVEANEALVLHLTEVNHASIEDGEGEGLIINDDGATIRVAGTTVTEAEGEAVFRLSLSQPEDHPVKVRYVTVDGSARSSLDYGLAAGPVTFEPGQTNQTITVPIWSDLLDEATETFDLRVFTEPEEVATLLVVGATCTVRDDDGPQLKVDSASVLESRTGPTTARFTFRLDAPTPEEVRVDYSTEGITATVGQDFIGAEGTLVFPPGVVERWVDVTVLGDLLDEPDEKFVLRFGQPIGARGEAGTIDGMILDEDVSPSVIVEDSWVRECSGGGWGGELEFEIRLSAPSAQIVEVPFEVRGISATPDVDFASTNGVLRLGPGMTEGTIRVAIACDDEDERNEELELVLGTATHGGIEQGRARAQILDDDPPNVGVADFSVTEGDDGVVRAEVQFALSTPAVESVTLEYSTEDGTATAGSDYVAASGHVLFEPGVSRQTLVIEILGDRQPEAEEVFQIRLVNPIHARLSRETVEATIYDNDVPPVVDLVKPTNGVVFLESLPVELAAEAADADGAIAAVAFYGDEVLLAEVTGRPYAIVWTNASVGSHTLLARAIDNDGLMATSAPVRIRIVPIPQLTVSDVEVQEGQGVARFILTLSVESPEPATVRVSTRDGTATAGSDFGGSDTTVQIQAGQTNAVLELVVIDDLLHEGSETFSIELREAVDLNLGRPSATVTILDDDDPPTNQVPVVEIIRPGPRVVFSEGEPIFVEATAMDPDGEIDRVEFRVGGVVLGEVTEPPYRLVWEEAPLGDHALRARAWDRNGASSESAAVRVAVGGSCGRAAIIRNVEDPEIETLLDFLFELGVNAEVFGRESVSADTLMSFDLVIWHDGGARGLTGLDVEVLREVAANGKALYFMGDSVWESLGDLDEAEQSTWKRLTGLREGPSEMPGSKVTLETGDLDPAVERIVREGKVGTVQDFSYGFAGRPATLGAVEDGFVVLARAGVGDVLLARPESDGLESGRRLTQVFRVTEGGDDPSLVERKKLFQNAIWWLLDCVPCSNLNLLLTGGVEPDLASGGSNLVYAVQIRHSGGCEALSVRLAFELPPGLEFLTAESARGDWTREGDLVRFNLGRLPHAATEQVSWVVRPNQVGTFRTLVRLSSLNETSGALDDNQIELEFTLGGGPSLRIVHQEGGSLALLVDGSPGVSFSIQAAGTLAGPWSIWMEFSSASPPLMIPLPEDELQETRFFRIGR